MSSGDTVIFTFDRRFDDGPHDVAMRDAANSMRPHLARAGLLAARLGLERAQTMVATLAAIGLPAAVLTASGRVLAANQLMQDLTSVFLMAAHDGLGITDAAAHALLQQSLEGHDRRNPVVRSIPVMANDDRGPRRRPSVAGGEGLRMTSLQARRSSSSRLGFEHGARFPR